MIDADLYEAFHFRPCWAYRAPRVQEVYGEPRSSPLEAFGDVDRDLSSRAGTEEVVVLRGTPSGGIIKQFFEDAIW